MLVKKTKAGRFTIALSYEMRDRIFQALINHVEIDALRMRILTLSTQDSVMRHLFYTTANEMLRGKDFRLTSPDEIKWTVSRAHAITLMWLLRHYDHYMPLLQLKSELHKTLQS